MTQFVSRSAKRIPRSTMGTSHSHATPATEWKGPFSDREYECIGQKYNEMARNGVLTVNQPQLQRMLELPIAPEVPEEWRSGLSRLGTTFGRLCIRTREERESTAASARDALTVDDFVRGVAQCTRSSSQSILRALFHLFAASNESVHLEEVEVQQLLFACLVMASEQVSSEESRQVVRVVKALAVSANPTGTDKKLSMDDFVRWTSAKLPLLHSVFASWMSSNCLGSLARPGYTAPEPSHSSEILSQSNFVALSMICTPLQKRIDRVYTSAEDGLSFNRLCHHILGYSGPTLMVIRDSDGDIFGMYCDTEWRETTRFYGSHGCFLFRLQPTLSVCRVTASGTDPNCMYLNTKGYALPRGLGMGGTVNGFRLFLTEDIDENSYTASKCLTFESGRLTTRDNFSVDALEVWGCGGDESFQRQKEYRKDTADMINKMRKVDKATFAGNEFDRDFLLSKTFGHGTNKARIAEDEH